MVTKGELARRIANACRRVCEAEEPAESDSFYDKADCRQELKKICEAIEGAVSESAGSIKELLDDAVMAVMVLGEGKVVSLWYAWLDGLEKAAPDYEEMSVEELKNMSACALREIQALPADKDKPAMTEVLITATAAIISSGGSAGDIFRAAAATAENTARLLTAAGGAAAVANFFAGLAK